MRTRSTPRTIASSKVSDLPLATSVATTDVTYLVTLAGNSRKVTKITFMTPATKTLTFSSTIVTDVTEANVFTVTVTGSLLLDNPVGAIDGQVVMWYLRQDAIGGHSITLGTKFNVPTSAIPLVLPTTASKMTMVAVRYEAAVDKFHVVSVVPGY